MRYWCNGSITAFQAVGEGSNPLYRSKNPFSLVNTQFKAVHEFLNYYFLLLMVGYVNLNYIDWYQGEMNLSFQ